MVYNIWYKIWYGGPARHAGLAWPAGRPDFFFEGPRPAPPARILMAPEAPPKKKLAGRPGRHGGPAPHTIFYTIFYIFYIILYIKSYWMAYFSYWMAYLFLLED